jgi:hypothetical protein
MITQMNADGALKGRQILARGKRSAAPGYTPRDLRALKGRKN